MKKIKSIVLWIWSIFFLVSGVVFLPSLASIVMFLVSVLLMPVNKIQELIKKIFPKKGLKVIITIILIIASIGLVPKDTATEQSDNAQNDYGIEDNLRNDDAQGAVISENNTVEKSEKDISEAEQQGESEQPEINAINSAETAEEQETIEQSEKTENTLPNDNIQGAVISENNTVEKSEKDISEAERQEKSEQPEINSAETAEEQETIEQSEEKEIALPKTEEPIISNNSTFEVHFIDVGQADAALVVCDGKAMLIDGGNSEDSNLIYTYLKNQNISHLDYIVATHAHEDHIGGLSGALNYSNVDIAYCSVDNYDSEAFEDFEKYLAKQNKAITIPDVGEKFDLGSAQVQIIGIDSGAAEHNNTSIVLKIVYGETSFLFTGDAEREAEQIILNSGYNLSSTVLKVGHHGSETSTTYPFLRQIMPEYAVISVGTNNSYGHPTEDTLSRLRDAEIKVFRTDLQGDIICKSDGKSVNFTVEKNPDADTLSTQKLEETVIPTPAPEPIIEAAPNPTESEATETVYIGNKNSKKFHYDWCSSTKKMNEKNKYYYTGSRDGIIAEGYKPCDNCNP